MSARFDFQQLNKVAEGELTPKQKEVLKLMGLGLSNKEIARELAVSPETIKTHAKDLFGRLGVKNRTQAASISKRFAYA
jgi:DNA-binding NarL/FixJ family response regulator